VCCGAEKVKPRGSHVESLSLSSCFLDYLGIEAVTAALVDRHAADAIINSQPVDEMSIVESTYDIYDGSLMYVWRCCHAAVLLLPQCRMAC
jgi:hypothetical protein